MDHDDAIVGRILGRREALLTAAKAGVALAAWKMSGAFALADSPSQPQPKVDLVASPVLTEGPFFVDEKLNRSDLTSDTKRASVINGAPLLLAFTVYQLIDKQLTPLKDAYVDVWHTDAAGVYSDENNPMNHEDTSHQTWLRGYQVADKDGLASFKTIFPGWYPGRTTHIHFKVRQFAADGKATSEFTSQLFFHEEDADRVFNRAAYSARGDARRRTTNERDGIYREPLADGTAAGSHLLLDLAPSADKNGFTSKYAIVLTNETMHGHGRRGPRRGNGGPGNGPPPNAPPRG